MTQQAIHTISSGRVKNVKASPNIRGQIFWTIFFYAKTYILGAQDVMFIATMYA